MDNNTVSHIINALRLATVTWHVRSEVLRNASKIVQEGTFKNGKPKNKRYFQCAACKDWFRDPGLLEVDHIVEIGPFRNDWDDFIKRMFCDISNLQLVCIPCHQKKTTMNARDRWQRVQR